MMENSDKVNSLLYVSFPLYFSVPATFIFQFYIKLLFSVYYFTSCSGFVHNSFLLKIDFLFSPKVWVNRSAASGSERHFHVGL